MVDQRPSKSQQNNKIIIFKKKRKVNTFVCMFYPQPSQSFIWFSKGFGTKYTKYERVIPLIVFFVNMKLGLAIWPVGVSYNRTCNCVFQIKKIKNSQCPLLYYSILFAGVLFNIGVTLHKTFLLFYCHCGQNGSCTLRLMSIAAAHVGESERTRAREAAFARYWNVFIYKMYS